MISGIHTILVQTTDMERSVRFFREVLGLEAGYASSYWSDFALGEARLGVHPAMVPPPVAQPMQGAIIGIATDDILALWAKLRAAGAWTSDELHDTPSGAVLNFADPEGNTFQAIQLGAKAADLGEPL